MYSTGNPITADRHAQDFAAGFAVFLANSGHFWPECPWAHCTWWDGYFQLHVSLACWIWGMNFLQCVFFPCLRAIPSFFCLQISPDSRTLSSAGFPWHGFPCVPSLLTSTTSWLAKDTYGWNKDKRCFPYACPFMAKLVQCQMGKHKRLLGYF